MELGAGVVRDGQEAGGRAARRTLMPEGSRQGRGGTRSHAPAQAQHTHDAAAGNDDVKRLGTRCGGCSVQTPRGSGAAQAVSPPGGAPCRQPAQSSAQRHSPNDFEVWPSHSSLKPLWERFGERCAQQLFQCTSRPSQTPLCRSQTARSHVHGNVIRGDSWELIVDLCAVGQSMQRRRRPSTPHLVGNPAAFSPSLLQARPPRTPGLHPAATSRPGFTPPLTPRLSTLSARATCTLTHTQDVDSPRRVASPSNQNQTDPQSNILARRSGGRRSRRGCSSARRSARQTLSAAASSAS